MSIFQRTNAYLLALALGLFSVVQVNSLRADEVLLEADSDFDGLFVYRTTPGVSEYALDSTLCWSCLDGQFSSGLRVTPFFRSVSMKLSDKKEAKAENEWKYRMIGANAKAWFRYDSFWADFGATFDQSKQTFSEGEKKDAKEKSGKIFGLESFNARLGCDVCASDCGSRLGVYILGGGNGLLSPTKFREKKEREKKEGAKNVAAPEFPAVSNYRLGAGLNGCVNLYDCGNSGLDFKFDVNYNYSFIKTFIEKKEEASGFKFAPGHTINGLGALNYGYDNWNLELGGLFSTTFGEKIEFTDETGKKFSSLEAIKDEKAKAEAGFFLPKAIKFSVQPYAAVSYEAPVCGDSVVSVGLGAGYEYDVVNNYSKRDNSSMHGFNVFGSVALSF